MQVSTTSGRTKGDMSETCSMLTHEMTVTIAPQISDAHPLNLQTWQRAHCPGKLLGPFISAPGTAATS
jgi:hypothetical protein